MKTLLIFGLAVAELIPLCGCIHGKSAKGQPSLVANSPVISMTNSPVIEPATNQAARIIVKWRMAPGAPEAAALRARTGTTSVQIFASVGDGRMEVLQLSANSDSREVMKTIEASGLAEYVELDRKAKAWSQPLNP